ncbi:sigma-54-dependent transcriptional regulator [Pseudahrensia aquimaris]|uniref:Sigma-54-dependent transcriptional regulator n=1 Tax=Pseudahrensia aquimaris TaxID=744461 RepID=A0ABW3FF89_9HYPH
MTSGGIIFIDDEEDLRVAAEQTFDLADLPIRTFTNADAALEILSRDFTGIVISDIRMPGMQGTELMRAALEIDFELPVILVTGHGDVQMAVEAMRDGAYDFIEKPFAPDRLVAVARRALDKRRLTLENRQLRGVVTKRDDLENRLTGRTPVMLELRKKLRAIGPTETDVLIEGATGTGKEVVARALHELSDRADKPFVAINCGALDAATIESELFGHEVGAFPNALRSRFGKFEHARGGTVFLDEIGAMPDSMQLRLLRVVEDRQISRLGSNELIDLDIRFLAATKDDLEKAVANGTFRSDLFYRLSQVTLAVPALADRREDIPRLFLQLANEAARRYRRDFQEVPTDLLAKLSAHNWPGNVRELRNAADRYVLGIQDPMPAPSESSATAGKLSERLAEHEKLILSLELAAHQGVLKEVYESLGLSRKALYEKMQRHGLKREDFKKS